ncbi:hypothetical protein PC128_g21352 [Phytophthora cactorum]|nr:hypothetical protein PC120_g19289 [Phytophthora cactorum]KAG3159119.1 hypothetical protein PC128_g21352 [Phytophthora cactorum]KAG4044618.1 hypothetical protein PC123_g19946 [Phytophthora cactorum]
MHHLMNLYSRNDAPADFRLAAWLQAELSIRREILTLPLPAVKGKKRKTANVSGQILTAEMMKKKEQKETKKTKKTTAKTDTDMKKTGAAKFTKGAKLVDPTNITAAVNTTKKVRAPRTKKAKTVAIGC